MSTVVGVVASVMGVVGAATFLIQLVLYGAWSGADEATGRLARGDRLGSGLVRVSRWLDALRGGRAARVFRWFRNIVLVLVALVVVPLLVMLVDFWFFGGGEVEIEATDDAFADLFAGIAAEIALVLLMVVVAMFVVFALLIALAVYVLQLLVFGIRGRRSLLSIALEFMGRNSRRILQTSGTLSGVSGAVSALAFTLG